MAALTAAAVLSLASMYLYAKTLGPLRVPIGDLEVGMVGTEVQVAGVVASVREVGGGLSLEVYDPLDGSRVDVFVPQTVYQQMEGLGLARGVQVTVVGTLQLYQGRLEILVTSPDGIVVVSP